MMDCRLRGSNQSRQSRTRPSTNLLHCFAVIPPGNNTVTRSRWTSPFSTVNFAPQTVVLGAVGGAYAALVLIPFHPTNPVPSSVEVGASNHCSSRPPFFHASRCDGAGFTLRHRL